MTNMPEAKLAREAEMCYATVAMVTDYDCWHPQHGEVDIASIIATLSGNAGKARALVARLPALLGPSRTPCPHGCDRALTYAILTAPDKRDPALVAKLDAVAGRVLGGKRAGTCPGNRSRADCALGMRVAMARVQRLSDWQSLTGEQALTTPEKALIAACRDGEPCVLGDGTRPDAPDPPETSAPIAAPS